MVLSNTASKSPLLTHCYLLFCTSPHPPTTLQIIVYWLSLFHSYVLFLVDKSFFEMCECVECCGRFVGGELNACYNAVDRHVAAGKGGKVALIHDSPVTKSVRKVTYAELQNQVSHNSLLYNDCRLSFKYN